MRKKGIRGLSTEEAGSLSSKNENWADKTNWGKKTTNEKISVLSWEEVGRNKLRAAMMGRELKALEEIMFIQALRKILNKSNIREENYSTQVYE